MKRSELKQLIKEVHQELNETGGKGFFGLEKGKQLSSRDKLKKNDLILFHSQQFNADNLLKVISIRAYGKLIQYDCIYWDAINNKKIGKDTMSVASDDLDKGGYYIPK